MTNAQRIPIFAMPALDPASPNFIETMNGLAGAADALDAYLNGIRSGKFPGMAVINGAVEAIIFFAVPGEKDYAREYLKQASLMEFAHCVNLCTAAVQDYADSIRNMRAPVGGAGGE